ncbi:3-hydroxyacyl-ACP dehydratase FabZ family protein [Chitinophaga flava]|uniref:Beta-hydroxyacyl-ACP dehydratase n=1 Tax=Chitinophaga flava TaxID=2259036 RepID=A0A365XVT0_9BACT|nr:3-hydroxyacyl-ACP dehydratase FabZ family protein [Chitinophaga flava]RBL90423.1 beta-hydroxyacyl-ACP dehydratase [Chitinophaga flava]
MRSSDAVETLIPHRAPFLFADRVTAVSNEEIIGYKTFSEDSELLKGSFPAHGFVPGVILIESMAQCGGAGIKLLGLADGLFGLAGIETARFMKGAHYGVPIRYAIKNIRVSEKIIKQSGIAYMNEEPVMEATWTCVKIG